jgi:hypothetical protein
VTDGAHWLPYRLLGSTARARLQQKLEGVVKRWLDSWGGAKALGFTVRLPDGDDSPASPPAAGLGFRVRVGAVDAADVHLFEYRLGTLLGLPLDRWSAVARQASATSLAERLWHALVRGLVNELMDSASIGGWELEPCEYGATSKRTACGPSQEVSVSVGDNVIVRLKLAPLLINALVPAVAAATGARTEPRRHAIGRERVGLQAVLGEVAMSLADFASLRVGDVIVLEEPLGSGCRIAVPGVAVVADAVLGKRGTARAVRISRVQVKNR